LSIFVCEIIKKVHDGFNSKKYISKYINIIKIGAIIRTLFWPALLPQGFSIRIQLFGWIELHLPTLGSGNTKGGSITVQLTSGLTGLESAV
jgi:hypothetical protein